MTLYCLGPRNTYSDLVAQNLKIDEDIQYTESFSDIVTQVSENENSHGLIVVENSVTSSIHTAIDLLFENRIHILAEAFLNVRLHLIGSKDTEFANIKKVYSKEVALRQCKLFLTEHNLEEIGVSSTAKGLEYAKKDLSAAAIGGSQMVDESTKVIYENIGDQKINKTRFLVISQTPKEIYSQDADKLTVILSLPHKKGSLAEFLTVIAKAKGNLTKIESRPIAGTEWEYRFWLDIEFDPSDKEALLEVIKQESLDYSILGLYKRGETFES